MILHLVEISHADFSEVTRMVFVEIGPVVVLATCHTATTGMLAVLPNATITGRDVAAARNKIDFNSQSQLQSQKWLPCRLFEVQARCSLRSARNPQWSVGLTIFLSWKVW